MEMPDLFDTPIRTKKVRKDLYAYQYRNGTIVIGHQKYVLYSMTDAIQKYRRDFPAHKKPLAN